MKLQSCLAVTVCASSLIFTSPDSARGQNAASEAAKPVTMAPAGAYGIVSSGESSGDHPRFLPIIAEAGVNMARLFPEWAGLQPSQGQWDWSSADSMMESARKNNMHLLGGFWYLTPWASSGGTRNFPIKDIQYWRDYVEGVVARYKNDIHHWEVYNEFNSPAFAKNGTPKIYAELVKNAYEVAKKANPNCKVGIGCASVDISFLEQSIMEGASGCFDFVNVHPYELLGAVVKYNRESVFLQMAANLRAMLKKTGQRKDIELWVSEVGAKAATGDAESERTQAEAIVKLHTLSFAQGMKKVFWFEARGPYKMSLIRSDWSPRPSLTALKTMIGLTGLNPSPGGWLTTKAESYGFVIEGGKVPVLVAWASKDEPDSLTFSAPVTVTKLDGTSSTLGNGQSLTINRTPVFITGLPAEMAARAKANKSKPFPWLKDFSKADSISCHSGAANVESGLSLLRWGDGETVVALVDDIHVRRTDRQNKMYYMYFDVDDSYASVGDRQIEVTFAARRVNPGAETRIRLCYESEKGYKAVKDPAAGGEWWTVPPEEVWHQHTFTLTDANFANGWGWNFRLDVTQSQGDVWLKEAVVKRIAAKQ